VFPKDVNIFPHQVCSRSEFSSRKVGTRDGKAGGDSQITRKDSNTSSIKTSDNIVYLYKQVCKLIIIIIIIIMVIINDASNINSR